MVKLRVFRVMEGLKVEMFIKRIRGLKSCVVLWFKVCCYFSSDGFNCFGKGRVFSLLGLLRLIG